MINVYVDTGATGADDGTSLSDAYIGAAQALEFDIHYTKDTIGSNEEYVK